MLKNKFKQLTKQFYHVNSDVEPNFPLEDRGFKNPEIIQFDKTMSTKEIEAEIESKGYVPANLYELLQYAEKGWNGKDLVAALGSVAEVGGHLFVPFLDRYDSKRFLSLYWRDCDWSSFSLFLLFRDSSLKPSVPMKYESLTLSTFVTELEEVIKKYK